MCFRLIILPGYNYINSCYLLLQFHCLNGRILLSTKVYESAKSVITETYSSVDELIAAVNQFITESYSPSEPGHSPTLLQPSSTIQSTSEMQQSCMPTILQSSPTTDSQHSSLNNTSFSVISSPVSPGQQLPTLPSSSITPKRSRNLDSHQQPLSKRLKCIRASIDEEIEKHRKGSTVLW